MEEKITVKEAKKQYKANNGRITAENVNGFVVLKDINKVYGNRVQAVFNFNLAVEKNEFIVLVGPSGCGKSTTLRMIAGLEEITDGRLYIDNVLANYLESKDRDIAMVFQSYALYPNMSVYDNIGFGLQVRGLPKEEIKQRVFKAAEILDLGSYLDRKPRELSGGQMQRVALGRAIVRDAKLFLMDEPLSNLDAKLRGSMRREILLLHKKLNATMMYVTHDQTEALTLADRIVCMSMGHVQQIGVPIELYERPANTFVATFIGLPPMNMFEGKIEKGNFVSDLFKYPLNARQKEVLKDYDGQEVILGVRPENITRDGPVKLLVTNNENLGMNTLVHGKVGGVKSVVCKFAEWCSYVPGDEAAIGFDPEMTHFFERPQGDHPGKAIR